MSNNVIWTLLTSIGFVVISVLLTQKVSSNRRNIKIIDRCGLWLIVTGIIAYAILFMIQAGLTNKNSSLFLIIEAIKNFFLFVSASVGANFIAHANTYIDPKS